MILLDKLLVGGLRFVLDKISLAAQAELDDPDRLREVLMQAQLQFEAGEIGEDELAEIEETVLARLRELGGGGQILGGAGGAGRVEAEITADTGDPVQGAEATGQADQLQKAEEVEER